MDKAGECKVYKRFTKTRPDGTVLKLRIQDMPEENMQDLLDLTLNHFIVDEPVHRSSGLYLNEVAKAEYSALILGLMGKYEPQIIICCEDEDPVLVKGLAGATITKEATEMTDLSNIPTQTEELKKLIELGVSTFYTYDPVTELKVERFLDDVFIVVHPSYRRLGIAQEFVHLRRVICRELNIPVTVAWMSVIGTQRAAEVDNWETIRVISYDDLAKKHGVVFDNAPPTTKLMIGWAAE